MAKWFLLTNDESSGPFSTEQVKSLHKNNLISRDSLIWSRRQNSWISTKKWLKEVDSDLSLSAKPTNLNWYFALNNKKNGPFSRVELIEKLAENKSALKQILLWTKGMKNWNPLFEFTEIINELGINARQFPRTTISGNFLLNENNTQTDLTIATISENGIGILNAHGLIPGQNVHGDILSENLSGKIRITAEVKYIDEYGFAGLEFTQINMEAKQSIVDYIKAQSFISQNKQAA